jgi:hypothetical protein
MTVVEQIRVTCTSNKIDEKSHDIIGINSRIGTNVMNGRMRD